MVHDIAKAYKNPRAPYMNMSASMIFGPESQALATSGTERRMHEAASGSGIEGFLDRRATGMIPCDNPARARSP
jgi:hypothetical protein